MPGSSIIRSASAGVAISADRTAAAPRNFKRVIDLLLSSTPRTSVRVVREQDRLLCLGIPGAPRNGDHASATGISQSVNKIYRRPCEAGTHNHRSWSLQKVAALSP